MAIRKINESTLTAIGNAIRAKTGGSALIDPEDMASEIDGIPSGGGGGIVLPSTVKIAEITAENNPRNLTIPIPEGHQNHKYYILAIQGSFNRTDWLYITPNHVTGTDDSTGKYIHAGAEKDYELTFVFLQYTASTITGRYATATNISTSFPITNFYFSAYEAATTLEDGFSVVVYGGD